MLLPRCSFFWFEKSIEPNKMQFEKKKHGSVFYCRSMLNGKKIEKIIFLV